MLFIKLNITFCNSVTQDQWQELDPLTSSIEKL